MATPIRQRIRDLVASTLLTIKTANGYEHDVTEVWTDQKGTVNIKGFPSVAIVDRGDQDKRLAQGIYEARMLLELRTFIEDNDRASREQDVAKLAADAQRAIMTRENGSLSWNGLAVHTLVQSADLHTSDASDPYGMCFLLVEILYRVSELNPYQVALI